MIPRCSFMQRPRSTSLPTPLGHKREFMYNLTPRIGNFFFFKRPSSIALPLLYMPPRVCVWFFLLFFLFIIFLVFYYFPIWLQSISSLSVIFNLFLYLVQMWHYWSYEAVSILWYHVLGISCVFFKWNCVVSIADFWILLYSNMPFYIFFLLVNVFK